MNNNLIPNWIFRLCSCPILSPTFVFVGNFLLKLAYAFKNVVQKQNNYKLKYLQFLVQFCTRLLSIVLLHIIGVSCLLITHTFFISLNILYLFPKHLICFFFLRKLISDQFPKFYFMYHAFTGRYFQQKFIR